MDLGFQRIPIRWVKTDVNYMEPLYLYVKHILIFNSLFGKKSGKMKIFLKSFGEITMETSPKYCLQTE